VIDLVPPPAYSFSKKTTMQLGCFKELQTGNL